MSTTAQTPAREVDAAMRAAGTAVSTLAGLVGRLETGELAGFIPRLSRLIARCESVKLSALRAAEVRRVEDLTGARSTADWVAEATGDKPGRARADVELAGKLDGLDTVAGALADGSVSKTQAEVLSRAKDASDAEQAELLKAAGGQSVVELEQTVKRFNADRDRPDPEVVASMTITEHAAGVSAQVSLGVLDGELLATAVTAASQQLTFERGTALTERRAKGLVAISRYFLEHAETGQQRLGRPHVIVDIPHETLASGEGSATLGAGKVLDAATARRLACDAGISRLITGPNSEPFDIGRSSRSIPAGLAKLLLVEDQGCRWPGCRAPAWACEGHHVRFWEGPDRGETSERNVALQCWHHHHLIHKDPRWTLSLDPVTRRLDVYHDGALTGSTHPPGRKRTGPAPAPAPGPSTADSGRDPTGDAPVQTELFEDLPIAAS